VVVVRRDTLGRPRTHRAFVAKTSAVCDICDRPVKVGDEAVLESGYLCHAACSDNPDSLNDDGGFTDDDD
jgi:hypothetical protein